MLCILLLHIFQYRFWHLRWKNIDGAFFISGSAERVFAEQSSTEKWLQKREEFIKQSLYEVAAKCFNRGENYQMEKIAKAYHLASFASRFVSSLLLTFKFFGKKNYYKVKRENATSHYIGTTLIFSYTHLTVDSCFKFTTFDTRSFHLYNLMITVFFLYSICQSYMYWSFVCLSICPSI